MIAIRSAVTALGVSAWNAQNDETDPERARDLLVAELGRSWAKSAGRLGRRNLRIFRLHVMHAEPIGEIADDYGLSPKQVRRIVDQVRDGIRGNYGLPIGDEIERDLEDD